MNEKREWLNNIEHKSAVQVVMVPNKYMETPAYEIRRVRDDEAGLPENSAISHQIPVAPQPSAEEIAKREERAAAAQPAGRDIDGADGSAAADDCDGNNHRGAAEARAGRTGRHLREDVALLLRHGHAARAGR